MHKTIAIGVGLCILGLGASARADHHMEMPKPAKELEQLKAFLGNKSCNGKMLPSPMGPGGPAKAKYSAKLDHGGWWVAMRYEQGKTKTMPAMSMSCTWGFDPGRKTFTEACWDSMGGISHGTSKGWQNDKWVWEEEGMMGGQKMKSRTIAEKKGKGMFVKGEMAMADGKMAPVWESDCK